MGVPRVYAPTPLFLFPARSERDRESRPLYPGFAQPGCGTPLFQKGRACIAFLLKVFQEAVKHRDPGEAHRRNEVVIPAYNARSLAFAALETGLKIRLVDIDPMTFFPTLEGLNNALSDRTLAVLLPYNWGIYPTLASIEAMHQELGKRSLFWVDDFATSVPSAGYASYFNRHSPCLFHSFGKTKIMTIMDGGYAFFPESHPYFAVLQNAMHGIAGEPEAPFSVALKKCLINLAYQAYTERAVFGCLGQLGLAQKDRQPTSAAMSLRPLSAGWARRLESLIGKHFSPTQTARLKVAAWYHEELGRGVQGVQLFPTTLAAVGSRFPVLCRSHQHRAQLRQALEKVGIGVSFAHDTWLGGLPLLKEHLVNDEREVFPGALEFQDRILCLPLHPRVKRDDVVTIAGIMGVNE